MIYCVDLITFFLNFLKIGVLLLYNVLLVSAVQQCESAIYVYIYLFPLESPSHPITVV